MVRVMLSVVQSSKRVGVSPHTIRAWMRERRVPFYRLGRRVLLAEDDVDNLITQSRVEAIKEQILTVPLSAYSLVTEKRNRRAYEA